MQNINFQSIHSPNPGRHAQQLLIENMLSVIDSKIQYVDFKLKAFIRNQPSRSADLEFIDISNPLLMKKIENTTKITNRLLVMRSNINSQNVDIIFSLLSNNDYLNYPSDELVKMIKAD